MQSEFTLKERAGRMYRQLLVLQRVFRELPDEDDAEWLAEGDRSRNAALRAAIREMLDELSTHAGILMSTPFPISEWRPGDGSDDERWRALTEIERREMLALLSEYENLIAWSEAACGGVETGERTAVGGQSVAFLAAGRGAAGSGSRRDAAEYLEARRTQLGRFRKELTFLERRRNRSA